MWCLCLVDAVITDNETVLPGLYVGNYSDSKDERQLNEHKITHILAIHDRPRRLLSRKHYLCIAAADTPKQDLAQYFAGCNDFIHGARLRAGNVLIHCLAGKSRSVTVAVAYIMSVMNLRWKDALKVVRAGRAVANPNVGFQAQLQEFETHRLAEERKRLKERFPSMALYRLDRSKCLSALNTPKQELLQKRDACKGNCVRGEKTPSDEGSEGQCGDQVASGQSTSVGDSGSRGCECVSGEADNSSQPKPGFVAYTLNYTGRKWTCVENSSEQSQEGREPNRVGEQPGTQVMENVVCSDPDEVKEDTEEDPHN